MTEKLDRNYSKINVSVVPEQAHQRKVAKKYTIVTEKRVVSWCVSKCEISEIGAFKIVSGNNENAVDVWSCWSRRKNFFYIKRIDINCGMILDVFNWWDV